METVINFSDLSQIVFAILGEEDVYISFQSKFDRSKDVTFDCETIPPELLMSFLNEVNEKLFKIDNCRLEISDILDIIKSDPTQGVPWAKNEEIVHAFRFRGPMVHLFSSLRRNEELREREFDDIRPTLVEVYNLYILLCPYKRLTTTKHLLVASCPSTWKLPWKIDSESKIVSRKESEKVYPSEKKSEV